MHYTLHTCARVRVHAHTLSHWNFSDPCEHTIYFRIFDFIKWKIYSAVIQFPIMRCVRFEESAVSRQMERNEVRGGGQGTRVQFIAFSYLRIWAIISLSRSVCFGNHNKINKLLNECIHSLNHQPHRNSQKKKRTHTNAQSEKIRNKN